MQVDISVYTAGLPAGITDTAYSCSLEDVEGRFTIIVPAVEILPNISYTCLIDDATVLPYKGAIASN